MSKEEFSVFRKNEFNMQYMNNRRSVWSWGIRSLDCRYGRFESRSGHGCLSFGFVGFCVVIGLCDRIILPFLCVCVCLFVWVGGCDPENSTRGDLQQLKIYKFPL